MYLPTTEITKSLLSHCATNPSDANLAFLVLTLAVGTIIGPTINIPRDEATARAFPACVYMSLNTIALASLSLLCVIVQRVHSSLPLYAYVCLVPTKCTTLICVSDLTHLLLCNSHDAMQTSCSKDIVTCSFHLPMTRPSFPLCYCESVYSTHCQRATFVV